MAKNQKFNFYMLYQALYHSFTFFLKNNGITKFLLMKLRFPGLAHSAGGGDPDPKVENSTFLTLPLSKFDIFNKNGKIAVFIFRQKLFYLIIGFG